MAYAGAVLWVLLFAAIGLGGLVVVVCYGVWLAHKISDVYAEVAVLARQAVQLAEMAGQITGPQSPAQPDPIRDVSSSAARSSAQI